MGFIIWLFRQYKCYKLEKSLPSPSQDEKDRMFRNNYMECIKAGFTQEQILALMNLLYKE